MVNVIELSKNYSKTPCPKSFNFGTGCFFFLRLFFFIKHGCNLIWIFSTTFFNDKSFRNIISDGLKISLHQNLFPPCRPTTIDLVSASLFTFIDRNPFGPVSMVPVSVYVPSSACMKQPMRVIVTPSLQTIISYLSFVN